MCYFFGIYKYGNDDSYCSSMTGEASLPNFKYFDRMLRIVIPSVKQAMP